MARIRSIHPGIFTDENFMSASLSARMLLIGVWTEAFDDGVFEWKPITLKARIFPADNIDVVLALDELVQFEFVKAFEVNGKRYGLIRNFCKFQRPKKPNSSGVLPNNLRPYCGMDAVSSEPVPNQYGTSSELCSQMEDGGWREEEINNNGGGSTICVPAAAALPSADLKKQLEKATGWADLRNIEAIGKLVADGFSLEDRIIPLARSIAEDHRRRKAAPPTSWAFLDKPVRDPSRQAKPCSKSVEMASIKVGSPQWNALVMSGKSESYLRTLVRRAENGAEALFWPVRDLPTIQTQSAA